MVFFLLIENFRKSSFLLIKLINSNVLINFINIKLDFLKIYTWPKLIFFSTGATTPVGGCILQPSSGL